jgi:hypothetical protein
MHISVDFNMAVTATFAHAFQFFRCRMKFFGRGARNVQRTVPQKQQQVMTAHHALSIIFKILNILTLLPVDYFSIFHPAK